MAQRIKSVKQETLRQIYACHVVLVMTERERRTNGQTNRPASPTTQEILHPQLRANSGHVLLTLRVVSLLMICLEQHLSLQSNRTFS